MKIKSFLLVATAALVGSLVAASLAKACTTSDYRTTYFNAIKQGVLCQNQNGVAETSLVNSDFIAAPGVRARVVSLKCNNGQTFLGIMSMEKDKCRVETVSWSPASKI